MKHLLHWLRRAFRNDLVWSAVGFAGEPWFEATLLHLREPQ